MYRYVGNGFLPGIPARDLTNREARQYMNRPGFDKLYMKDKPVNIKVTKERTWQEQEHSEKPN